MTEAAPTAAAVEPPVTERPSPRETLRRAIGGPRGIVDSGLPAAVFVAANALGGLRVALWVGMATAVVLLGWRLARRQSVQQAVSGFIGVAICVAVAASLDSAGAFFLPGIVISAGYGVVFLASVVVRRPLVGYVYAFAFDRDSGWAGDRLLRRAYALTTLGWAAVFALRAGVQGLLYAAGSVGWLSVAKLGLGWPLTLAAVALTLGYLRRTERRRT